MAEERIVERSDGVNSERTIERGAPTTTIIEKRGGGGGLILGLIALVAVGLIAWFLIAENRNDTARTDAISGAASSVAESVEGAAEKVGDAADGK